MKYFVLLPLLACLLGADWSQHLGPLRNGHSSETGLARQWPKDGPPLHWKQETGHGWAGPAVADGRVYLFHRVGNEEVLECLSVVQGELLWKKAYRSRYVDDFEFDDGPRAVPLVADGRVITLGADGDLTSLDAKTGAEQWRRNINRDYGVAKAYFGVGTSPMLAGGKLLINVGAKGAGIVAFDPATGKELWKASNDGVSYSSPIVATIEGKELAIFFTRAGLLALDPTQGEIKYQHPWRPRLNASVNAATPIAYKDQIYLSTSYGTGAIILEAEKGELKELWKGDEILSNHYSTPVLIDGYLYGVDGRQEGNPRLRCVEWKSGEVKWTRESFGCAGLVAVDGLVIAVTEKGDLVLFEPTPKEYREKSRATALDSPVRALPAFSDGRLYIRDPKALKVYDLLKEPRKK
jgi:outer membrane protein assembly factor BamB